MLNQSGAPLVPAGEYDTIIAQFIYKQLASLNDQHRTVHSIRNSVYISQYHSDMPVRRHEQLLKRICIITIGNPIQLCWNERPVGSRSPDHKKSYDLHSPVALDDLLRDVSRWADVKVALALTDDSD